MKPLVSLSLLASLALLAPALAGCGASGGGTLFAELDDDDRTEPGFLQGDGNRPGGGPGGGTGGDTEPGDGNDDPGDALDSPSASNPLATELSINQVILYQAVGIALMHEGAEVSNQNAPVVIGKDAMIRAMVRPEAGWQGREVIGRLTLHDSSGPVGAFESKRSITAASTDADLQSSFNFDIPGKHIAADTMYSISLHEASRPQRLGDVARARWPLDRDAAMPLRAQSSNGSFKFTIIPFRYNGYLPDTSEKQIERFREKFAASYPVPDVEIEVHAPVDHSGTFTAHGQGWEQLLRKTCNLRGNERPARNNYYYGIISPTANIQQFCGSGCVAGLAGLAVNPSDNGTRCAIGLGYSGNMSVETGLHELGHALGREHAPCGLGGQPADRRYPYPNGGLGSWGWEHPARRLHHPSNIKDFMSYCQPVWISDYTYKALFERIAFVNASPYMALPPGFPEKWASIVIEVDGSLHWGGNTRLDSAPSGTPKTLYLLDENGNEIGDVTGFYYGNHHLSSGSILVPEDELAGAKAIRLPGRPTLSL